MSSKRSRTSPRIVPASIRRTAAPAALAMGLLLGCGREPSRTAAPLPVDAAVREAAIEAIRTRLLERNLVEAATVAESLVARAPTDPAANAWLARVRVAESAAGTEEHRRVLLEDARRRLDLALAGGIDDAETLALAAACDESLGDFARASERWRRLVERRPDDPAPLARLGLALARSGRGEEATSVLDAARARHPDDAFLLAALAEARLEQGDAGAITLLAEARRLDPATTALRVREAVWLRRLDRAEEAIALLAALPEEDRASPAVAAELAASWRRLGEPRKVAEVHEACARRAPRAIEPWLLAAEAWIEAGDLARARAAWEVARSLDPSRPELGRLAERMREG